MAIEKYDYFESQIKQALTAHRKELFPNRAEYKELIAEGIRLLEDRLMNINLEPQKVIELQAELRNLRIGEISETLVATLKANRKRETPSEIPGDESHIRRRPRSRSIHKRLKTAPSNEIIPEPKVEKREDEVFTFNDLRLQAEDKLLLEPPSSLTKERFFIKVIGYLKGSSIIITTPIAENGLRIALHENEKVVIRSFSGKNAFAFVSRIIGINSLPFEYLHLSIPETIQGVKVRKVTRIKTNIIATVTNDKFAGNPISAVISDICEEGALIESKQLLGVEGDVIQLAFRIRLHNVIAFPVLKAVIRSTIRGEDTNDSIRSGFIHHGIKFQDIQPDDHIALQSMIYQQMIENPQSII